MGFRIIDGFLYIHFLCSSDIDVVVFGKWDVIPIHALEKELVDNKISDRESIKVLDKASVSIFEIRDLDGDV